MIDDPPGTNRPETTGEATPTTAAPIIEGLYCPDCGYDLRGLPAVRCPECGLSVESLLAEPGLPWIQRREIGRFRAYWKTVWTVMFRPKRFAREILRPVSYRDAQRFRWVTVAHAVVPPLLITAFACLTAYEDFEEASGDVGVWGVFGSHVLFFLFLVTATGLPSYFFHPRWLPVELQNRAIALSYYTCAALAWMWAPMIAVTVILLITSDLLGETLAALLSISALLLGLGCFVIWWFDLKRLAARTLRRPGRVIAIAVGVPVLWSLAVVLILGVIPLATLFVYNVIISPT